MKELYQLYRDIRRVFPMLRACEAFEAARLSLQRRAQMVREIADMKEGAW